MSLKNVTVSYRSGVKILSISQKNWNWELYYYSFWCWNMSLYTYNYSYVHTTSSLWSSKVNWRFKNNYQFHSNYSESKINLLPGVKLWTKFSKVQNT